MQAPSRALVIVALAAGPAGAEPARWTGYVHTPGLATTSAVASSKIVYVKRCAGDCEVQYDPIDDARTGRSSIAAQGGIRRIGPFAQPASVWTEMMACVRATFAPFDIAVVDSRPADGASYFLHLVGGKPTELHPSYTNAGGVAPFDCGEIPNAISYTFDVYGPDPLALCWTVSQEVAHAFGLEHQFLQKDPMTYLAGDLPKRFRDVDAPCGELEQAPRCSCGGTTQNSYRHIVGVFGPGAPTPPAVTIDYPKAGKPTQPGFAAVVTATDDVRVDTVELSIDGTLVSTAMTPLGDRFELPTGAVDAGPHTLEVRAVDVQGVASTATLAFMQGLPCTRSTVCTGDDVCVAGICVPGPDVGGGLGAVCSSDTECISRRCADAGETFDHCVEECDVAAAASCPDEFTCLPAGDTGVCWPVPSGGCCDAGGGPQGALLLAGLGVLRLRRRRARA